MTRRKRNSNSGPSAPEVDALTTRPTRRSREREREGGGGGGGAGRKLKAGQENGRDQGLVGVSVVEMTVGEVRVRLRGSRQYCRKLGQRWLKVWLK